MTLTHSKKGYKKRLYNTFYFIECRSKGGNGTDARCKLFLLLIDLENKIAFKCKFARKTSMLTLCGLREDLRGVITFPDTENPL